MASSSVGGRPTCVSYLVLLSYTVLLFIGFAGLWLWGINLGYPEASPPTPPPENTITTTTTTTTPNPSGYRYHYREDHEVKVPQAYIDYVYSTRSFARPTNDPRLYLAPLSLACLVVAGFTLLVGLCFRQLFGSTFNLYSSLCLWILTLVLTIMFQYNFAWEKITPLIDTAGLILGYHILLLVFLPLQMLLCVWELQRQQPKDWPTLNLRSLFTMESVLLSARLTLTVFTFDALLTSKVFSGFSGEVDPRYKEIDYYNAPRIRFPIQFALVCFSVACFNAAATLETTLSMLLGRLHRFMTTAMCLLSGLCCIIVAALCSPVYVVVIAGQYSMYPNTMIWGIALSVVTFLHWLGRLIMPTALSTPPHILILVMDRMSGVTSLADAVAMIQTQGKNGGELLFKNMKKMKYGKHIDVAFVIFSIISLAMVGVSGGDTPTYRMWGHIMVLCGNSVTLLRVLPPLVTKHFHQEMEFIPVKQRLFALGIETMVVFVGGIVVCTHSYFGIGIFAGVANVIFALFQMMVICSLFKDISQSHQPSEDTKHLTKEEEVNCKGGDQTSTPDAMA